MPRIFDPERDCGVVFSLLLLVGRRGDRRVLSWNSRRRRIGRIRWILRWILLVGIRWIGRFVLVGRRRLLWPLGLGLGWIVGILLLLGVRLRLVGWRRLRRHGLGFFLHSRSPGWQLLRNRQPKLSRSCWKWIYFILKRK